MRKLHFSGFLLLFIIAKTFAQSGQVFNLNKLSNQDTLLSGWKFHAGDNKQWAETDFDDRKWEPVDPSIDIRQFSQLKKAGVGWLRLHLRVDGALANDQIAAWVYQFTASEIYLNGKLIKKFGSIDRDPVKTVARSPDAKPFVLKLANGTENVIAVRLGYESGTPYFSPNFITLSAFSIYVNGYQAAFNNYAGTQDSAKQLMLIFTAIAGIFLILSFIHLVYFIFDKSQKVNLYYFIFSFSICLSCGVSVPFFNNIESVSLQMLADFIAGVTFVLASIFAVLVIYTIFNYLKKAVLTGLIIVGVCCVLYMFFDGSMGWQLCLYWFPVLCMLEAIRISIWAIKQQKKDAKWILPFIVLCNILNIWSSLLDETSIFSQILSGLAIISLPIGMSFYLGIQNAVKNKNLTLMLGRVQTLSRQNLANEQEKQAILTAQNDLLEKQVNERTYELNQSLTYLKATQTQLIQSEKMASLGELTAGIAHEIQNPLNFVNNFSEVSVELLAELKEEEAKGNKEDFIAIADDLTQNLEKIRHHGKRADAIVKGMLQHSQSGSGTKEPTNINSLADEYLRLSYHGLRSKDKSFNAEMVTHFDEKLPQINVIPQDIGRVFLNLFNNAFYAINQKQKTAGADYKPEVSVSTYTENGQVVIKVKDNGIGIPDAIKEKIMQPFFTTKPTGEGTGLGLSLTYDMVVKGHGGTIAVASKDGEGSEFTISLPIN